MSTTHEPALEVQAIIAWWHALYPDEKTRYRGNAAARSALRHAESPFQALLLPDLHELFLLLRKKGVAPAPMSEEHLRRIAVVACVICECRDVQQGPKSFAAALGVSVDGERQLLSPQRFQKLMAAMDRADGVEQMAALRRALQLLKGAPFNVSGFVRDILWFSNETRIAWTFDYYGTSREGPSADTFSDTEETSA